jgi:hypothetical protein
LTSLRTNHHHDFWRRRPLSYRRWCWSTWGTPTSTNVRWRSLTDVNRLNKPTSIDLGWSTSINSFSDADYPLVNVPKMFRKIKDNPSHIISNNPGINRAGKYIVFQWFSLVEYLSKIFRKTGNNRPHIPIGNIFGLLSLFFQVFRGIFRWVTAADYFEFSDHKYFWFSVPYSDRNPRRKMHRKIARFMKDMPDIFLLWFCLIFYMYSE